MRNASETPNQQGDPLRFYLPSLWFFHGLPFHPSSFTYLGVWARADWPAWNEISGHRYWNHAIAPCPKCCVSHKEMISSDQVAGMTLDGGCWPGFTSKEYLDLIQKSKVVACLL
jgi:hypothetical protein